MSLTDEQLVAVQRRSGRLSLSAAAGSGKTAVLVERFVAAVLQDRLSPSQILAITFTDRAAGELRERVRAAFLELGERAAARDTEAAYVSTIHGFCARLLAAHPLAAGLDPGFRVLDEGVAGRLRGDAFQAALGEFVRGEEPEAVALVAAYGPDRLRSMVEAVHAQLRSRGERLPRLPSPPAPRDAQSDDARAAAACLLLDRLLGSFTAAYEAMKLHRAAVDFDDLELLAAALLSGRREIRESWSARFELVMVDEFQDTNRRQLQILGLLERENLFTVGDEFQAIYGFRHAEVAIFRERAESLSASGSSLALTLNFRSRPALVATVGAVFEDRLEGFTRAHAAREPDPQPDRVAVELLLTQKAGWEDALGGDGASAIGAGLPRAPLWRQAEARLLARRVGALVAAGEARPREVVVLLRALGDIAVYERALQQQGLATLASAGAYWEGRTVEDLLAYLRVLANPLDEEALYACLAGPFARVSRDGMALLALAAQQRGGRAFELAIGAGAELGLAPADELALERFCVFAASERAGVPLRPLGELISRALQHPASGEGSPALAAGQPGELANAYKLARLARRFEESEGRDLRGFLDHVAYLKEQKRSGEADAPALSDSDAVRLMSIHAAKGLEFPVVCVADLGRAPNKRTPELLVEGNRIGLRLAHLDGSDSTPALDYQQLSEERRADEALEEDRILYVAMTRARERLLLSGALELPRRSGDGANGTNISWLAPALAGDLGELEQQMPPGGGLDGIVLPAASGGEDVRCLLATPQVAAALLPAPAPTAAESAPAPTHGESAPAPTALAGAPSPTALAGAPSPTAGESAPAPTARGVNPAQLTLEDAVASLARRLVAPAPPTAIELQTASYSSLKELERCGYRYYLERVLGMEEWRAEGASPGGRGTGMLDALSRGSLIHRVLELHDFAETRYPTPGAIDDAARELGMRPGRGEAEVIAGLLGRALRESPALRIAAAEEVWREHPFSYPAGGGLPLLTGVIDVLAKERGGGWMVVDYKSDPVGAQDDLEKLVARDYTLQRELYALAVLRAGGDTVEVLHWFLERPGEWASARFQADERGALQASLETRVRDALRAGFAVSPNPHRGLCATCPGRARLCSWPESATMAEQAAPAGGGS
ncbi:MAG TPA: ATP-dependent DNA helicase [Solirubrobacteraceae bacterium]|nr:ATP-dependent DNA helicase [Solirubrobacteraceae bacterium]